MSSSLIGLFKKLEWTDFRGSPSQKELQALQNAAASSGQTVGMAGTSSTFNVKFSGKDDPVLNSVPGASTFVLDDNVIATVVFDPQKSWKRIDPLSDIGKDLLLDHEQGHYDISALMARDCFIDIMQLKAKTYATKKDGEDEAKNIVKSYKDKLQKVQDEYDDDTTHGAWVQPSSGFFKERKSSDQLKWENFFNQARTSARASGDSSPDGIAYKIRLLDVLKAAGFNI
ncbi:MAG TPA: DUF922 domain-containing protein [Bryobacteraceae bacterium]|nr:DUF922 domain-containing protein [Bryobacteraceae bacterium]